MAKPRPNKNKDGEIISYTVRVFLGRDRNGKQIVKSKDWAVPKGLTPKQVQKKLTKFATEYEDKLKKGIISANHEMRLDDFCAVYLDIKKDVLAPRVYADYSRTIDNVIIPTLGHIKLSQLKPAHIQQFVLQLQGDVKKKRDGSPDTDSPKLSAASIKRKLAVLQSILSQAVKLDYIPFNPADSKKLTLPKPVKPKVEIFSKQEAAEMLSYLTNEDIQFQVLVQLAIMTGCRCGELVALKFSDIDFINRKVTVERSAYKLPKEPISIKPPKDYEVRTISVNSYCIDLIRMLKAEKEREALRLGSAWHNGDWLFTQWNGEIMNPQTPSKQFSKFLEKNGLKHRKFHSLRHTSATLLLYGKIDIKQVQERLGHADITTTNKYLHCIAEADEEAANVLQDMLITKRDRKEEESEIKVI